MSEKNKNDVYCSQPANKSSSWILKKWRSSKGESSSEVPQRNDSEESHFVHNRQSFHLHRAGTWAIPDDESENWSKDVETFYRNGDAPFCYSAVFTRSIELDKKFWGTLLGFRCGGYLTSTHIEGWVGRLMAWRNRMILLQKPLLNLRWTILPPQFYEMLLDSTPKNVVKYANGKLHPFPSFFEVDYVFFPLPLENNEWLLARLELSSQELVFYPCEDVCVGNKYRNVILPRLTKVKVYLGALLVHLQYWKKTGKPEKCICAELNDNYVVSNTTIAGNEAVYLCMLMEHLVTDKPINITGDICKTFLSYRQFIAEKLYFWRCLPRPNAV